MRPHRPLALALAIGGGILFGIEAQAGPSYATKPCPMGDALLTHLPTNLADIAGLVPLGNLNPKGHTIPTRHVYFYPTTTTPGDLSTAVDVPVRAPAKSELVAVEFHPDKPDWSLHIRPCKDIAIYYFHVNRLSPAIAAAVGDVASGGVAFPGPFTVKPMSLALTPGQVLGTAKTFDMGLQDFRKAPHPFVNPARYAVDLPVLLAGFPPLGTDPIAVAVAPRIIPQALYNRCPIDYFTAAPRALLTARLSDYDGAPLASGTPRCHSHMQDVPGTAQGNWFNDLDPVHDALMHEDMAIALVNWNVDPTAQLFSLNENVPGFSPSVLEAGAPASAVNSAFEFPVRAGPQRTNRRFAEITDYEVYCYDKVRVHRGGPRLNSVILVQVADGPVSRRSKLSIEFVRGGDCRRLPMPWRLSPKAAVYYR
jgi:hypothetical protein